MPMIHEWSNAPPMTQAPPLTQNELAPPMTQAPPLTQGNLNSPPGEVLNASFWEGIVVQPSSSRGLQAAMPRGGAPVVSAGYPGQQRLSQEALLAPLVQGPGSSMIPPY